MSLSLSPFLSLSLPLFPLPLCLSLILSFYVSGLCVSCSLFPIHPISLSASRVFSRSLHLCLHSCSLSLSPSLSLSLSLSTSTLYSPSFLLCLPPSLHPSIYSYVVSTSSVHSPLHGPLVMEAACGRHHKRVSRLWRPIAGHLAAVDSTKVNGEKNGCIKWVKHLFKMLHHSPPKSRHCHGGRTLPARDRCRRPSPMPIRVRPRTEFLFMTLPAWFPLLKLFR
jgi:hypothetical protein